MADLKRAGHVNDRKYDCSGTERPPRVLLRSEAGTWVETCQHCWLLTAQ